MNIRDIIKIAKYDISFAAEAIPYTQRSKAKEYMLTGLNILARLIPDNESTNRELEMDMHQLELLSKESKKRLTDFNKDLLESINKIKVIKEKYEQS